jgi:hypothetical protein
MVFDIAQTGRRLSLYSSNLDCSYKPVDSDPRGVALCGLGLMLLLAFTGAPPNSPNVGLPLFERGFWGVGGLVEGRSVTWTDYILELQGVIRKLHGVEATHVGSVPITESRHARTVWDGTVEVFTLHGHPRAEKLYAWAYATNDSTKPHRQVSVLHIPPVTSALMAVRVSIVREFRSRHSTAAEV